MNLWSHSVCCRMKINDLIFKFIHWVYFSVLYETYFAFQFHCMTVLLYTSFPTWKIPFCLEDSFSTAFLENPADPHTVHVFLKPFSAFAEIYFYEASWFNMHLVLYSKFLMKFLFLFELTNRSVQKKKSMNLWLWSAVSDLMDTPGLM